jgi:hypothetical protein
MLNKTYCLVQSHPRSAEDGTGTREENAEQKAIPFSNIEAILFIS